MYMTRVDGDLFIDGMRVQESPTCAMNRSLTHDDWADLPPCDRDGAYLLGVRDLGMVMRFCLPHYKHVINALDEGEDGQATF